MRISDWIRRVLFRSHVATVARWLARLGLDETDLECGTHWPSHEPSARALARAGGAPSALHNNCSGKHTGMLATALHRGEPTRGYVDAAHTVQQRVLGVLEQRSEEHTSELQSLMRNSYA